MALMLFRSKEKLKGGALVTQDNKTSHQIAVEKQRRFFKLYCFRVGAGLEAVKKAVGLKAFDDWVTGRKLMTFEEYAFLDHASNNAFETTDGLFQLTYIKEGRSHVFLEFIANSEQTESVLGLWSCITDAVSTNSENPNNIDKLLITHDFEDKFFYDGQALSLQRVDI